MCKKAPTHPPPPHFASTHPPTPSPGGVSLKHALALAFRRPKKRPSGRCSGDNLQLDMYGIGLKSLNNSDERVCN